MARTRLTPVEVPRTHPGGEVVYTWEAADVANKNDFLFTGREVLLIKSADGGEQDVIITSAPDSFGRSGDLTVAVAASAEVALAFLDREGWMQSDGTLYLECSVATLSFAVLRLP
jgi:hypothetical protein